MGSILRRNNSNSSTVDYKLTISDINDALTTINSRWKLKMLSQISIGENQFTQLKAAYPTATNHSLTKRLLELEEQKFIVRVVNNEENRITTNYVLTAKSKDLLNVVRQLQEWRTNWKTGQF